MGIAKMGFCEKLLTVSAFITGIGSIICVLFLCGWFLVYSFKISRIQLLHG